MNTPTSQPIRIFAVSLIFTLVSLNIEAADASEPTSLANIQLQWAQATYEVPETDRVDALGQLAEIARAASESDPGNAELLIWRGIVTSSLAGEKGGLGALGLAKEARQSLESALAIDPNSLDGSAYTSLGTLYHKVPGWPIGFGSDKKALKHLEQAVAINPDGIDSNYFMAEFLFDEGDYAGAVRFAQKAARAGDRPERALADAGRRKEIAELLDAANAEIR